MEKFADLAKQWREQFHAAQIQAGMKLCPECDGYGELEYERPVVDWMHGGYLEGYMDTCEKCDGEGYVEDEDAEI